MPAVTIRMARVEDDRAIGELLVSAFVDTYARKMPEVIVTEERKAELRQVAAKRAVAAVLVAELESESGKRIVGTAALFPVGAPGSQAWTPQTSDFRHLAVSPDAHGHGLSARLVAECERIAREWGNTHICLHIRRGADGIGRMYERLGFVREPQGDASLPTVELLGYLKKL